MLDICLLGTAGMVPLKDRWLASLYIYCNGHATLIDCGEGTQIAISEAGLRLKPIDTICITHFHADHIAGLTGLLLSMSNSGRTEDVTILGPPGLTEIVSSLLIIAPQLNFSILCCESDGNDNSLLDVGNLQIKAFQAKHVIPCLGYSITLPRRPKFNPEKAKHHAVPTKYWKNLQSGSSVKVGNDIIEPEMVSDGNRSGLHILYSTDTRPNENIIKYGQNADLMILEGNYEDNSKLEKAKEWGHMTFIEAAELAKEANVKELWLTHFSKSIAHPEEFIGNAKEIFPNSVAGHDGMKKTLNFPD